MTDRSADLETRIGEYAAGFSIDDVPEAIREKAKLVLLDTVGVCIRGARTDYVERTVGRLADHGVAPTGSGRSFIFATRDRRSPIAAALVNAAGGTTLELDEGNQHSGHMGIHIVPPALAYAEHVGASGSALLAAVVVAYETCARVGAIVRPMQAGLHPHGAFTPIGAAVAAGSLLGFDADEYTDAVRLATNPLIVGHWAAATDGATVRDFYTGLSCAHGIHAAALAAAGVTGVHETVRRCLVPYTARDDVDDETVAGIIDTLGENFFLESSYFKMHAACRYTHAPLEALEALREGHDIAPGDVHRITVRTFGMGTLLDGTSPSNPLAAKFSTPYVLAAFLVTGTSGVDAFAEERVQDQRIRELAQRVEVVAAPVFDERASLGEWGAAVEVELDDGTTFERTVQNARGGGDDPFTRAEIVAKFERLVGDLESDPAVARLRDGLLGIEDVADMGSFLEPLA